jgi:hypothetical protein
MKKLLTLTLFLLLFSCENDQTYSKETNTPRALNIWRYPVARILKLEPQLKRQIDELKIKKNQNKASSLYNFSIEETEAQVLFENNYTQYTFQIVRENVPENILENYICKVYTNGDIKQFLVSYPYSIQQNNIIYNGAAAHFQVIQDDALIIGQDALGFRSGCVPELISETYDYLCTSIPCSGAGHEFGHDGCDCGTIADCTPASQECGWVGTFVYGCAGGSSSGPTSPGGDGGLGTGTGGSSGTNSDTTGDQIITVPFQINKMEVKIVNYLNENTDILWLDILPEMQEDILSYFNNDSMFTDENKLFLVEILNRIQQNEDLFTSIKPFLIEKQIDDSQLDPCAKGVFQQVKNTTNNDFAKVLAKLGADGSIYNTTMISAIAPSGQPAQTIKTSAYNYKIFISTNYVDKTKLFIAASMVHELIHAYFMSIVDDYNLNPNSQNIYNLQSFPSLYQAWCDKNYPPTEQTSPNAHHADMAIIYVDAIAAAIKEYAINTGTANSLPNLDQICNDMAWGGLIGTPVFDDTNTPLTPADRTRIINRYEAEQRNLPIGDIPNIQNPISQPCN